MTEIEAFLTVKNSSNKFFLLLHMALFLDNGATYHTFLTNFFSSWGWSVSSITNKFIAKIYLKQIYYVLFLLYVLAGDHMFVPIVPIHGWTNTIVPKHVCAQTHILCPGML